MVFSYVSGKAEIPECVYITASNHYNHHLHFTECLVINCETSYMIMYSSVHLKIKEESSHIMKSIYLLNKGEILWATNNSVRCKTHTTIFKNGE